MGRDKTEQPKVSEVAVAPAVMILSSASTAAAASFSQDAAKTPTKPLVEILKYVSITAVLEIAEPAAKPGWTYAFGIRKQYISMDTRNDLKIHWGKPNDWKGAVKPACQ